MNDAARKPHDLLVIACAAVALAMAAVVVWAAVLPADPLSPYIHTDKMRHILGFGAIGLVAALMPSTPWRLRGLAGVLIFAVVVEIIQIPVPGRNASLTDLLASCIGTFFGFGLGAALTAAYEQVRGRAKS